MPNEPAQEPLPPEVLQALVEGVAAEVGEAFFDELVKQVARGLGAKGVWVTEWLPREMRLRALAFWFDGSPYGDYEYDVAGTPCEAVVEDGVLVHVPERVVELYPRDPDLPKLGAVSYMGLPLKDLDGTVLGHLAVLHDRTLPEDARTQALFRIFGGRAASELRRLRRERALREREEELRSLVASAMDAIVELDEGLAIAGLNAAALRVFGCEAEDVVGRPLGRFLEDEARGRLERLAADLARRPAGERSLWIPHGLTARRADGTEFPAEATLSGFELAGRERYTLILRNVDERLAAEERIRELSREAADLRERLDALEGFDEIVGRSPALCAVLEDVERVAASDATVLITGETGTGKELFARAIHAKSARSEKPLVTVNCAAIAANLQESEFFGHVKGAFTGALEDRRGRFEQADGGTIFLDEVGEMPKDLQAKLLRVLQEGELQPVGGRRTVAVDVRVVAATNRDLERMAADGEFRTDLLYRLNVFPLVVPPLRDRGEDVVLLARAALERIARRTGRPALRLAPSDEARLRLYDWPGNVRELENVMERAVLTSTDGRTPNLERALPGGERGTSAAAEKPDGERVLTAVELQALERANLARALEAAGGKVSGPGGAADLLGLKPSTLTSRLRALGIRPARES